MTVLEFIGNSFSYVSVEDFKKKFSSKRNNKGAVYLLLGKNINAIKTATLIELAEHFTGGDLDNFKKLIQDFKNKIEIKQNTERPEDTERPEERN